ncbi:coproporphyrinogen III oxidase [Pleomorphomonas diazotrophica]|uniref:Heme chaperone HemW n=1 Tax=Pleomorphomonas diazotrophica TaxID=1166257 RepID=A0A1I4SW59_9HYPH|nr:radical SAM family heme chaperone HemW [Pleomorphomonas diazotrophica]PKR88575.1 coproporphyrinogen III oxidase [Pleomorphomonas diazotrophica]SFM68609.1 coproporphyrinogen III oxidase, anaerobic [Pleomorphomonas diazotrophica]
MSERDLLSGVEAAIEGTPDIGFGVYIHWPFCARKCPYCDFNSHVRPKGIDEAGYLQAMEREIAAHARLTPNRTVTSVFLGGGTPSLMKPESVGRLLELIGSHWQISADAEITLEANPSSVEAERFRGYRSAGVNRLSLGVQALNDADLKFLGRLHNVGEALRALELARETFPRLSFDLIYARPDQSLEAWEAELRRAIGFAADHLSLYQLTIEPDTAFEKLHAAGKLVVPDADAAADLYELTQAVAGAAGLPAYEISNHATPGGESRHNLLYWRYGEYVGLGPGAHGRIVQGDDRGRLATIAERNPEAWMKRVAETGHSVIETEEIFGETAGDEMLLMGLRLVEGIDAARYQRLSGRRFDPARISDLVTHGMVEVLPDGRIRTTPAGAFVLDAVVADLAA